MTKRQRMKNNTAKHIKTSHKKSVLNRKVAFKKVDKTLKNINQIISKQIQQQNKQLKSNQGSQGQLNKKIELQTISAADLKKLISGQKTKQKTKAPKINLDQSLILQKLLKKWNKNYDAMSKDIKLNRMQWTTKQIQKKHQAFERIIEQQKN